jgi:cytoskeleton protein RodZ
MSETDKQQVIQNIAAALAERRKARNILIETVSEAIKIRPHILLALENGQWDLLPGEVYIRGFVTRYAQYLGLQPHELLNPYFDLIHQQKAAPSVSAARQNAGEPSVLPWIWGGVGLIVLIGLIKFIGSQMASPPVDRLSGNTEAVATEAHEIQSPSEAPVVPAPIVVAQPAPSPVSAPRNLKRHTLTVYSPNELWLKAASETRMFEGTIPGGSTWTFTGDGNISLRLGHTRDILLAYDGQEIPVLQKRFFQFNDTP